MFAWPSISFYCLFGIFVFYQQLHATRFRGASQSFGFILSLSAFLGMLTGFGYLIYYGWVVAWWAPFVVFTLGLAASFLGFIVERIIGAHALSIAGFVGWPVCAYFMFTLVPSGA